MLQAGTRGIGWMGQTSFSDGIRPESAKACLIRDANCFPGALVSRQSQLPPSVPGVFILALLWVLVLLLCALLSRASGAAR